MFKIKRRYYLAGLLMISALLVGCTFTEKNGDTHYAVRYMLDQPFEEIGYFTSGDQSETCFYDAQSGKKMVYCFDPACNHKSEGADPSTCMAREISMYNTYLSDKYLYTVRYDDWDSISLIRADKTGENQETLVHFDSVQGLECFAYYEKYAYFAFINLYESNDGQMGDEFETPELVIYRVDLDRRQAQIVYSCKQYAIGNVLFSKTKGEDSVYVLYRYTISDMQTLFEQYDGEMPTEEEIRELTHVACISLGESEEAATVVWNDICPLTYTLDGRFFIYSESDGTYSFGDPYLHIVDLKNMNEKAIQDLENVGKIYPNEEKTLVRCISTGQTYKYYEIDCMDVSILKECDSDMEVVAAFDSGVYVLNVENQSFDWKTYEDFWR